MVNTLIWQCRSCGHITPRHPMTKASDLGTCNCGAWDWEPDTLDDGEPLDHKERRTHDNV